MAFCKPIRSSSQSALDKSEGFEDCFVVQLNPQCAVFPGKKTNNNRSHKSYHLLNGLPCKWGSGRNLTISCCFVSEESARRIFFISAAFISCDYGGCGNDFAFHVYFHSNACFYQLYLSCGPTVLRIDIKFRSKFYISPVFTRKYLIAIFQSLRQKSGGELEDHDQNQARQLNQLMCCRNPADSRGSHQSAKKHYLILLTLIYIFTEMCFHVTGINRI